jgi:hypothetical protein
MLGRIASKSRVARNMKHHLMIGTWLKPGVIITVAFDDEKHTLELVKKTEIPEDEPISWMTFDVCLPVKRVVTWLIALPAPKKKHLWRVDEEMVQSRSQESYGSYPQFITSHEP